MSSEEIPAIPDEDTSDPEDSRIFQEVGWGVAAWQAEVNAIVSHALNQRPK
ncbi:MAG TPA: hypothetical protein VKB79_01215 [Bryobacteraceae bacterium]|nr:hypothetical protein [Bryobacteraceae bacterium]